MSVPHKLCMIPGPIEFEPIVLETMGTPATSHIDPSYINTFGETIEMLRTLFMCKTGQPFIISGSGTLGWDMVATNVIEPGESALIVNTGIFGDRFGDCLQTYGINVNHVYAPEIGNVPSLDDIKQAIISSSTTYKMITITHVDTSTGVLIDIAKIAKLVHELSPTTLIIVDAVCSAGVEEINMDGWGIDLILTASQKALGAPPGLSIIMANERIITSYHNRKSKPNSYYASWNNWLPIMKSYEQRKPSYFATPAVQLIMSLHISLKQILSYSSLSQRFHSHIEISNLIKNTITSWGLKLVPTSFNIASNALTAFYCPDGITVPMILNSLSSKGIIIAGGLHPKIATKYIRIGHMGYSVTHESQLSHINNTLMALKSALCENGFVIPISQ